MFPISGRPLGPGGYGSFEFHRPSLIWMIKTDSTAKIAAYRLQRSSTGMSTIEFQINFLLVKF